MVATVRAFTDTPMWHRGNAVKSWRLYLGAEHDGDVSPDASPAEARRSVEPHSDPGTFHGSALVQTAAVSRRAGEELVVALRRGLGVPG